MTHANNDARLYYSAKHAAPLRQFLFLLLLVFPISHYLAARPGFDQGSWTCFNLIYTIEDEEGYFIKQRVNHVLSHELQSLCLDLSTRKTCFNEATSLTIYILIIIPIP